MLRQVKSILQIMGQGLANQDLGEMSPTAEKIAQIEERSLNYRLSGGQGRIVLIASTDLMGAAFDFVLDLARQTKSLVEILYVKSTDGDKASLIALMNQLGDLGCDFQMTFLTGNLLEAMSDYNSQRQDIMAIVCSTSDALTDNIHSVLHADDSKMSISFPTVLFIGNSILA